MKDKIMLFVIGLLVGAVISTGAFFVYSKLTTCNTNSNQRQMPGGNPPSMQNGQLPEKPSGESSENGQSSDKPSDSNTQNNN